VKHFDRRFFHGEGGNHVRCEEQCAKAYAAAWKTVEADLMSGMAIESTFHHITSCNACHVDVYCCFISEKKASTSSVAARPLAMLVSRSQMSLLAPL